MYVYLFIYVYMCMYTYVYIHMYICVRIHVYVYVCVYVRVFAFVNISTNVPVCVCLCLCVCVCAHVCVFRLCAHAHDCLFMCEYVYISCRLCTAVETHERKQNRKTSIVLFRQVLLGLGVSWLVVIEGWRGLREGGRWSAGGERQTQRLRETEERTRTEKNKHMLGGRRSAVYAGGPSTSVTE